MKPFAVNKYLSKILKRVLQEDFTIIAIKLLLLSPDQASILVPSETRSDQIISSMHLEHLMSGPCLALCLLRENAVKKLLDLLGPANPREAKQKNQFLWRGLYGADPVNNALHGMLQEIVNFLKLWRHFSVSSISFSLAVLVNFVLMCCGYKVWHSIACSVYGHEVVWC